MKRIPRVLLGCNGDGPPPSRVRAKITKILPSPRGFHTEHVRPDVARLGVDAEYALDAVPERGQRGSVALPDEVVVLQPARQRMEMTHLRPKRWKRSIKTSTNTH